jgi:4-alpha-methyl-delta7-sterol-4alpha-methyl oxidase
MNTMQAHWDKYISLFPFEDKWIFALNSFAVHEITFWTANGLLFLCHYMGWFSRFKIQGAEMPSARLIKQCLVELVINHFLVQIPTIVLLYPLFAKTGMRIHDPLPSAFEVIWQNIVFFILTDSTFYWSHRMLHSPYLFKKIHSQHHRFVTTIGIASEFAHPVEQFFSSIVSTLSGPILLNTHLFTYMVYMFIRILETIDAHSGYSFPLSPFRFLPHVFLGPEGHDFHHSHNDGNFGMMKFWDWLMGTDKAFNKWKRDQAESKTKKTN